MQICYQGGLVLGRSIREEDTFIAVMRNDYVDVPSEPPLREKDGRRRWCEVTFNIWPYFISAKLPYKGTDFINLTKRKRAKRCSAHKRSIERL